MRCIEIFPLNHKQKRNVININMRCIEMKTGAPNNRVSIWININMRCIEILL